MSSPSRLQVALPAVVTFVFGLAFGLVAGRILWVGQPAAGGMAQAQGAPPPRQQQQESAGGAEEAQIRAMLAAHEGLLKEKPEDLGLLRTVGNYHAILNENDQALEYYAKAMDLAVKAGDDAQVTDILIDEGVSLVEKGDIAAGLRKLEEASAREPKNVRARLTRVAVYLERVMPQPPPGFDRKEALVSAESVLDEVDAIEPGNEFAVQFRATIDGVRQMMGRPRDPAAGAPAAQAPAAPATPASATAPPP